MTGGGRKGDRGYYVEPTVFADVKDDMKVGGGVRVVVGGWGCARG